MCHFIARFYGVFRVFVSWTLFLLLLRKITPNYLGNILYPKRKVGAVLKGPSISCARFAAVVFFFAFTPSPTMSPTRPVWYWSSKPRKIGHKKNGNTHIYTDVGCGNKDGYMDYATNTTRQVRSQFFFFSRAGCLLACFAPQTAASFFIIYHTMTDRLRAPWLIRSFILKQALVNSSLGARAK